MSPTVAIVIGLTVVLIIIIVVMLTRKDDDAAAGGSGGSSGSSSGGSGGSGGSSSGGSGGSGSGGSDAPSSGCPCPQEWTRVDASNCSGRTPCCQAPDGYAGACDALSGGFGGLTVAEKQAWADKCSASWSADCLAQGKACMCPDGWSRVDASLCGGKDPCCAASFDYTGSCDTPSHFHGYGPENKAKWAAKCGADWSAACKKMWMS